MSHSYLEPDRPRRKIKTIIAISVMALIVVILAFIALPAYQDYTYRNDLPPIGRDEYLEMPVVPLGSENSSMRSDDVLMSNDNESRPSPASALEWRASMNDRGRGSTHHPSSLPLNHQFTFRLDLSHVAKSVAAEQRFPVSEIMTRSLEASALGRKRVQLDAVLLTDSEFLHLDEGESNHKTLDIDLSRLNLRNLEPGAELLQALGTVEFALKSGATEGWTYAAVVLIKDNRALDQVIARFCTGHCNGEAPSGRVPGADTLAALLNNATQTDAALFLTELVPGDLHGVFSVANPIDGQRVWTWSVKVGGAYFLAGLKSMVARSFQNFDTPPALLLQHGENLADFVFPPSDDANKARAAFQEFVRSSSASAAEGKPAPSLFVKFDFNAPGEGLLIVPIGLMAMEFSPGKTEFLGQRVMIEQPLEHPKYSSGNACPSEWVALLPVDTTEANLKIAQSALEVFRSNWSDAPGLKVHNRVSEFRAWLREQKQRGPTSLMMLSHHDADRIFFLDDRDDIYAANVRSSYREPSIAILMGCSTGKPGSTGFVRSFNTQGVETIVVADFDLHPVVAGTYIGCLNEALTQAGAGAPLETLHFNAVNHCRWPKVPPLLSDADSATPLSEDVYVANAMKLSMLGNGKVRICRVPPAS